MGSHYATLSDSLACQMLTIDASTDDGWGAPMPVKGREVEATVLFSDITPFSAGTANLGPAEALAFVNHFFAWTSAEALRHGPGIVDKYIGDEVIVVFPEEFGSEGPLLDAVHAARGIGQYDVHSFMLHVGIASGRVIVGYVGTPQGYSTSVFGAAVALAARCARAGLPMCRSRPM
jgi:class 3 adenylate cyclase